MSIFWERGETVAAPSIALSSLTIRNFRGIESLDLDFRGPDGQPNSLAVLAGPNGSGKTAALEAGLILTGGEKLAVGRRGPRAVFFGATDYHLSAEFQTPYESFTVEDRARSAPPSPPTPIPHWYFSSWRAPQLVGPVDVSVGRRGPKPRKTDANRLKHVKQLLVNAAAVENFRKGQRSLVPRYSEWMSRINQAWQEFYPDSSDQFSVELVAEPEAGETGAFDVYLTHPSGSLLEVDELSSGQLELFLFLATLVLNDEREGIVFIDEPELHLDPQWHRLIIRSLTRLQPRSQFIIATHSPEIFDAARSYERHFLVPGDDPRARLWREVHDVGTRG